MKNFDTELDVARALKVVVATSTTVTVTERRPEVEVSPVVAPPSVAKSHLTATTEAWTWQQLRDYVVGEIEIRHGAFPRDTLKESGIFKGFVGRWGDNAALIAKAAFGVYGGYWRSAPIGIGRFTANSDPYFADVIAKQLNL